MNAVTSAAFFSGSQIPSAGPLAPGVQNVSPMSPYAHPGMAPGMLQGFPPGMSQGMPPGMPPGIHPGMVPNMNMSAADAKVLSQQAYAQYQGNVNVVICSLYFFELVDSHWI